MKAIYKYLLLCLLVVGLGVIPAWIFYKYEVMTINERFYWEQWKQTDEGKSGAKLFTLSEPVLDFGLIDPTQSYSREFILENIGDKILEVWTIPDTNSFVKIDLTEEKIEILGNSSYPITISFDGKDVKADFVETISIQSNDSRSDKSTLDIEVTGSIQQ